MNYNTEIVIDSDDEDVIFSDEEFQEEAGQKPETMDYTIEAIDKVAVMEIEERIPYDTKVIRNRNKKSRLIEEMMIEEMDIQNEQYVLKKVKTVPKDKGKATPQDNNENAKTTNLSEMESEVLQSDVPERLQHLYGSRPRKVPQEEIVVEAKWIARKLERKKKLSLDNDPDPLVSQVFNALDLMKNQYYEVMYIYTYKFNEMIDLTLEDLWFIQNRDSEWIQMQQKKARLAKESEEKIMHESTQNYIENLIAKTFDEYTLENISGYIQYKELTLNPSNSKLQLPVIAGLNMLDFYANKELKEAISVCISEIFLTPEDFAFNLKHNNLIRVPKSIHQRPADYFKTKRNLIQFEENNEFTGNMMSFFQTVTFLMAHELYFHPLVKAFSRRIYHEKVKISTRPKPTEDIAQKVDIYQPEYCVKRIRNRPFNQFKADETGIYLLKGTTEGKIDMCLHTSDENINIFDLTALSPDRDGMLKHLVKHFISQESDDQGTTEWNLIRKECINFLVHHLLYPHLQKELEKDILETSEKAVINSCADRLKYIINNGPCMSLQEERSFSNVVSLVITEGKQVLAVAIDRDGYYQDSSAKFNFDPFKMMNSQQTIDNVGSSKKEEYHKLGEFIFKYRPELIVLGDYRISRRIIRKIVRDVEDTPYSDDLSRNIIYSSTEIPKLLLEAPKTFIWNKFEPTDLDQDQCIAVHLGRMQQDALCEIAKLWSNQVEENQLLKVLSHDLQSYVNRQNLMHRYQEVLIEAVNRNGVDLNQMLKCTHRASTLQFVCGLGPIKAQYFIVVANEKQTKLIKQRNFIFRYEKGCFQDKIFWNSSGFIRIEPPKGEEYSDEYKPLDQTRIHPSWYGLAKKIEKDTFEEIPESLNNVLEKANRYPDLLKEVDIDDFATHLEQSKGMKNMKPVLEFIINELINPFKKFRRQFSEWNQEYLYFKMTGLCSFFCQIGAMVEGIITKVEKTFINVRLETGIECAVYKYEVFEKDVTNDLTKEFYEGQGIVARIVNLNYEHFKTDFSSLVKISLSLKPGVLNNHKNYILAIHPTLDEYNIMDPNDDYPVLISNKRKKTNFVDRMIMHNKFKNITADEAIDLLEEKDVGEVLFRPGKRTDQIYITWKFYDHMYIHVDIHEGPKLNHEPLSKKLTINKKTFSSLNEIIAHYIQPCNKFVKTVSQHAKFFRGDVNTIRQQLQMEKEAEPKYIPYHILFSKDAPQHALLCYLKSSQIETEYIKIDGSGYWFHDALFIVFEELIRYFKMNQSKPDYINYVHSVKKPFVEVILDDDEDELPSSSINSGFGIETIKWKDMQKVTLEDIDKVPDLDSIKVKQEKKAPMLCENCGVRGHQANQCPVSNDRPRRGGDFGAKRGGWNNQEENAGTSGSGGKGWGGNSGSSWGQSEKKGWGKDTQQESWSADNDTWGSGSGMQVEPKEKGSAEKDKQGGGWDQSSSWGNNTSSWGASSGEKDKGTSGWGSSTGNKWGENNETEKESGSTGWGGSSAWGGKRDDGDQKPRSKGCFKCGEEGHMARDCPNPRKEDGDRPPRSKGCFKCGEEGHMSRDCPKAGDSDQKPRSKGCFKCGEEGHMSRDCPKAGDYSRKMTCYRCGEEGHAAKGCTNPRKEGADPRGPWKPRDSSTDSTDRPNRGWGSTSGSGSGWGSTSGGGWGSTANASDSSAQITDTWGSGASKSQETKSGWGSGGNDSWGVQKGDTWGNPEKKDKMEVEKSSGWGNSSKPETKASTGDSWGVSDTWGSGFAKPQPKTTVADSWGSASAGSWGDSSKSDAKTKVDTWGAPAVSAWGESSKTESKPTANDSWGQSAQKEKSPEKSWNATDTWGEPSKADTKTTTNDTWGTPAASNSWGEISKPETKTTVNDSWGSPAASSTETKQAEGSSWGNSGGWGETPKGETKTAGNDSWGTSGGSTWGDSSQKEKASDSWGNSSWGEKKSNEQSSTSAWGESKSSAWGNSGTSSWGKSSDDKAESGGWGKSGTSSWGKSGDTEGGNGDRKSSWSGGRRDDGDRPRSKGCFKCGEEGHMARDCPNPRKEGGDNDRSRTKGCWKCGEDGHMARDCPNPRKEGLDNDRPRSKGCYKCGEEGHMSRDCPNPGEKPRKLTCYRCGEEGHGARGCTNPRKEGADPRGSWKPRDSHGDSDRPSKGWGRNNGSRSRSRSREKESRTSGWGNKSGEKGDSAWGKSSSGWGNSGSNDTWGNAGTSTSWGSDTWGNPSGSDSVKKNDTWGNSNDTWGSKQEQTSKSDTWGASNSNDNKGGWGSTTHEAKDNSGSWGTKTTETKDNSGGWGTTTHEAKDNSGNWGAAVAVAEVNVSNDGWGTVAAEVKDNSGGWGATTETKENSGGWGTTAAEVKDNSGGWGTTTHEAKDNSSGWGAATSDKKENAGETMAVEPKESTGDWGTTTSETNQNNGGWGTITTEAKDNSGGWGASTSEVKENTGETMAVEAKENTGDWGTAITEAKDNSGWGTTVAEEKENHGETMAVEAKESTGDWGTIATEVKENIGGTTTAEEKDNSGEWGATTSEVKQNTGETMTVEEKENAGDLGNITTEVKDNSGWGATISELKESSGEAMTVEEKEKSGETMAVEVKENKDGWEDNALNNDKQESPKGSSSENKKDTWGAGQSESNNNEDYGFSSPENKSDIDDPEPVGKTDENKKKEESDEEEGQIGTWDNEKEEKPSKSEKSNKNYEGELDANNNDTWGKQQTNEGSGWGSGGGW